MVNKRYDFLVFFFLYIYENKRWEIIIENVWTNCYRDLCKLTPFSAELLRAIFNAINFAFLNYLLLPRVCPEEILISVTLLLNYHLLLTILFFVIIFSGFGSILLIIQAFSLKP